MVLKITFGRYFCLLAAGLSTKIKGIRLLLVFQVVKAAWPKPALV